MAISRRKLKENDLGGKSDESSPKNDSNISKSITPATSDNESYDEPMSSKLARQLNGNRRRSRRANLSRKIIIESDDDINDEDEEYHENDEVSDDDEYHEDEVPEEADASEDEEYHDASDVELTEVRSVDNTEDVELAGGFVPDENIVEKQETKSKKRKGKAVETDGSEPKPKRTRKPKKPKVVDNRPRYMRYFDRTNAALFEHHPYLKTVFEDMAAVGNIKPEAIPQPSNIVTRMLPFQTEGLDWLQKQEKSVYKGGILADEMGMGKTIQTIALLASDSKSDRKEPNLVITPTVALIQWRNEISQHTGDTLTSYIYHGASRSDDINELRKYDIILTTYAVIESVYRRQQSGFKKNGKTRKEKSPLHSINWHRVILDEAHNIKDRTSNTARAVFNLNADHKLCLSGTPLQNRIGEVYSLLRFLMVDPFSFYFCKKCPCKSHEWKFSDWKHCDICGHRVMDHCNYFNHSLLKHIQHQGGVDQGLESMKQIRILMGHLMLRRTKIERADDLGLPPRVVEIRRDYFNEEEKDLYRSIYSDSTRKFNSYVDQGVVLNNYANIFSLITRMRQIADHPDLVLRKASLGSTSSDMKNVNKFVCKICDDEAEDPIESRCHHIFCRMCVTEYVQGFTGREQDLECPVCHVGLTIDLSAPTAVVDEEVLKKSSIVNRINMSDSWRSSTKIEALVEELYNLRSDRQTIKSIVFSQFTSMLDLVEWRLKRAGFQTVKLQGSMSPAQRDGIIRHFMENVNVEVFLVSLKAGGVALNLCEASQVFILDPWWNPSVEWQSGDRVHRIGQHRPVKITRLIIEDSIESRIVELQDKKASMIHATISQDDSAMNKLTPADMQFLFQN